MKLKLFYILTFCLCLQCFGQTMAQQRKCVILEHEEFLQKQNPGRKAQREAYETQVQKWVEKYSQNQNKTRAVITIPVVVHVLYSNAAENISDAQVISAMAVLNADFTRTNADTVNTPSAFSSVAGSPKVNWCLAAVDPNGGPTNGIVHKATNVTNGFGTNDEVKKNSSGGDDAWPTDKYFNIWVCRFSDATLLGYGEFPTATQTNTFGFVAGYTCYGTMGAAQAPFDKGRTATHEIGHCFNLRHIWGDANCGNDGVSDTPTQQTSNGGCPAFPKITCNNGPNGDMFMNYMDYVDDACMNTFTKEQSLRMLAVLNSGPYSNLKNSTVCTPPTPAGPNDAGTFNIDSPSGTICSNSINPIVSIRNFGSTALTSCTINYNLDGGSAQTFSWTGNLATYSSATVNLPAMPVTDGSHTLSIATTNPNGNADASLANDTTKVTFIVSASGTKQPIVQDFETSAAWPYAGYTLNNPDGAITWKLAAVGHSGAKAIYMENYNYQSNGEIDEFILPSIDLSSAVGSASLKFWLAYQTYTNPSTTGNSWDTLSVLVSTDCGGSWKSLYKKYGATLVTAATQFSTNGFTPTAADWREETVDLTSFIGSNNVMVKVQEVTNYENNLYIDDINLDFSIGIAPVNFNHIEFKLFPNPTNGNFNLYFTKALSDGAVLLLRNVLGEKLISTHLGSGILTKELDLNTFDNGVYFVEIFYNGHSSLQKIVLSK